MSSEEKELIEYKFSGKLFKKGKINKAWKERYFICYRNEQRMDYYQNEKDAKQKQNVSGSIDLTVIAKVELITENYDFDLMKQMPKYILETNEKDQSDKDFTFLLISNKRTFILAATDKNELIQWLKYLSSCLYGDVVKEGWMKKQGQINKGWKDRYFVLNKFQQMKYYDNAQKTNCFGTIDCKLIANINNGKVYSNEELRYLLELNTPKRKWMIAFKDNYSRVK